MLSMMVCMDTTDYMRNGDYIPDRLSNQQDAVNAIIHAHLRKNAENDAGIVTMTSHQVHSHLSTDAQLLNMKLYEIQPDSGHIQLAKSISSANLALKHRQSKHSKTKIVVFVGSPVFNHDLTLIERAEKKKRNLGCKTEQLQQNDVEREARDHQTENALKKTKYELLGVARRLRKEKVSVDVVSFGEIKDNERILSEFVTELGSELGRMISIDPGNSIQNSVSSAFDIGPGSGGAAGGSLIVDDDPDLMMALRISMEEQNQRMTADTSTNNDGHITNQQMSLADEPIDQDMPITGNPAHMTEEEQITLAMQMSLASAAAELSSRYRGNNDDSSDDEDEEEDDIDDDDNKMNDDGHESSQK